MLDKYNRKIDYLRVSVTDLCNLRCTYCMPEEGVEQRSHGDNLSFEEIYSFVYEAVKHGIKKVRITGGEPLVKRGILDLIKKIRSIEGIEEFCLTTNGTLLSKFAHQLKEAGIDRINVSLDAVNPTTYAQITRGGNVFEVFKGIETAKSAGFDKIKINCVIHESSVEPDALEVAAFARKNGFDIRYIRKMDMKRGEFWKVEGASGGDCENCNRLRITSDGLVKPCLFSDLCFEVRKVGGAKAIKLAVENKPKEGDVSKLGSFYTVGG
jgi:cyclic pyranopterin phosphate synthase